MWVARCTRTPCLHAGMTAKAIAKVSSAGTTRTRTTTTTTMASRRRNTAIGDGGSHGSRGRGFGTTAALSVPSILPQMRGSYTTRISSRRTRMLPIDGTRRRIVLLRRGNNNNNMNNGSSVSVQRRDGMGNGMGMGPITTGTRTTKFQTTQRRLLSRKANTTTPKKNGNTKKCESNNTRTKSSNNASSSSNGRRNNPNNNGSSSNNGSNKRFTATSTRQQPKQQRRKKATFAGGKAGAKQQRQQQPPRFTATLQLVRQTLQQYRHQVNGWLNAPRLFPVPRYLSPRHITYRRSECFGHMSFVLVAISYAVEDYTNLRVLAILGSSAMLVFAYFHPHGRILWLPFHWNCIFVALNSYRLAKVYIDDYCSVQTLLETPSLQPLYDDHFAVMPLTDFAKMVRLGTIEHYTTTTIDDDTHKTDNDNNKRRLFVMHQNDDDNRYVRLVIRGTLLVDRDGQTTYELSEGQFISEMGLHAGLELRGTVESCCSVKAATEDVELIRWDRTELMRLLELNPSIKRTMKAVMAWDIVSKLKSQRVLLASGKVDDPVNWTKKLREQALARYSSILRNMIDHPKYISTMQDQLSKYRAIHQITPGEHVVALERLGWTLEEFELGYKEGHDTDHDQLDITNLGYKWWFRSWWKAL